MNINSRKSGGLAWLQENIFALSRRSLPTIIIIYKYVIINSKQRPESFLLSAHCRQWFDCQPKVEDRRGDMAAERSQLQHIVRLFFSFFYVFATISRLFRLVLARRGEGRKYFAPLHNFSRSIWLSRKWRAYVYCLSPKRHPRSLLLLLQALKLKAIRHLAPLRAHKNCRSSPESSGSLIKMNLTRRKTEIQFYFHGSAIKTLR
jgi:hypothetical protein